MLAVGPSPAVDKGTYALVEQPAAAKEAEAGSEQKPQAKRRKAAKPAA